MTDSGSRPRTLAILCNPASGRCRRSLSAIRRRAAQVADSDYREASHPEAIEVVLQQWLGDRVAGIMVLGGDGTLQALLTLLLERFALPPEQWPALLVVGGGTTNMSARALGSRVRPLEALAAAAAWQRGGEAPRRVVHPVVRIEDGGRARCGFFFGGGALTSGVSFFQQRLRDQVAGRWGPRLAFLRLFLTLLRGGRHPLLPATLARLWLQDGQAFEGDCRLVAVSTFSRLMLGARPFWGKGRGGLGVALMGAEAPAPWWRLPLILMGRGRAATRGASGYLSARTEWLELELGQGWMLDGELYGTCAGATPDQRLTLRAVGPIDFRVFGRVTQ
ncbi:diacylglycerol kinase family enzyme [Kushneria sinocarnis]|uniref:Diacylglycerol kinase family enzyme n=1 Tax=Kushneria sinocarnis TaxID=595502 RepID=A0A420X0A5_9GAMM|nr:diacylglycerol kinase family protein [Kushneria sinocarnis]RKR06940.1 diacylglycerol kinase family enzyme [Kushneria sinocarnis]